MVYLPGSWPEEDLVIAPDDPGEETVEQLMSAPLAIAAGRIGYLADGEPGRGYVIYISESLRREPGIIAVRDGDWSSLGERVVLRSRPVLGPLPRLDDHLRYAQFARRSLPVLRRLREAHGIGELSLLVGIPSPLSVAAVTFGPVGVVLYERGFRQATARQIALAARLGEDVAFQVEAVLETVAVASVPPALRLAAAWATAGRIRALAALAALRPAQPHAAERDRDHQARGQAGGRTKRHSPPVKNKTAPGSLTCKFVPVERRVCGFKDRRHPNTSPAMKESGKSTNITHSA